MLSRVDHGVPNVIRCPGPQSAVACRKHGVQGKDKL